MAFSQQATIERTIQTMRAVQGGAVLRPGDPGLDIYAGLLAASYEDDSIREQIAAWDSEFSQAVREAIRRGNISGDEAASIGYGGLGAITLLGAALIFGIVLAVAWQARQFGAAWVNAMYQRQTQLDSMTLAHARKTASLKVAGEAWAAKYAKDHNIPFPAVPDEGGETPSSETGSKAVAAATSLGTLAIGVAALFAAFKVFGGRKK